MNNETKNSSYVIKFNKETGKMKNETKNSSYVIKSMLDALEQIGSASGGLNYRLSERSPAQLGREVKFSDDERKKLILAYTNLEEARELVYKAIRLTEEINLGYTL